MKSNIVPINAESTEMLPLPLQPLMKFQQHVDTKLFATLKSDLLVGRNKRIAIPPKVEYTLTELGKSLVPPLMTLYEWANASMPAIKASRERHKGQSI